MKVAAFILRGQPLHNPHQFIIRKALQTADRVIIILGSLRSSVTIRNPWSFDQRASMIRDSFTKAENNRICIEGVRDFLYSMHTWATSVQAIVAKWTDPEDQIALHGHFKDDTSYYLKWFPQWELISHANIDRIDATTIRKQMFECNMVDTQLVPTPVADFLLSYMKTEEFERLKREYNYIVNYKKQWEKVPYPPTFVTTDAVVVHCGHVLVVVRGREPGKGYFALPGGFLDQTETVRACTIRELREETKIDVPAVILEKNIKETHVFDHPLRSLRGRTITHASLIELDFNYPLPKVKGADDADEAVWMPFNELDQHSERFFEDHLHIISFFMSGKLYNR